MRARLAASSKARPDNSRTRARVVACLLCIWMIAIVARLVYLQTSQHSWLLTRARAQQEDAVETSPIRGLVLDRHGNELARSVEADSFWAVPGEIKNVEETAARLAPVVDVDAATLASRLKEAQSAKRKFAWVARKLDSEQAAKVRALNIEGLYSIKSRSVSIPTARSPPTPSASSALTKSAWPVSSSLSTRRFAARGAGF